MKTITTHGTFEEAIADRSDQLQGIARALRELIIDLYPDVVEVPWPRQGIIGYGVGPKKMSEHYCYIGLYKAHVNLGFYYGVDLDDPEKLLSGTGKKLRHLKIEKEEIVGQTAVRNLLQVALAERQHALQ